MGKTLILWIRERVSPVNSCSNLDFICIEYIKSYYAGGRQMKKTTYILCVCLLCIVAFIEIRHNIPGNGPEEKQISTENSETGSERYVPTARFASQVKRENETIREKKKTAYLTFDDGPSDNTRKILDVLEEKKAVATFFLIGNEITPEREDIVKKTLDQGNAIGVHTFCHEKNKLYCNADSFFEDFKKATESIQKVTGKKPLLHRFPWGSNNGYVSSYVDALHEKLSEMGVKSFDWNVSGEDAIGGTVAQSTIFNNVKKDLKRYDEPIILLHDSATMDNTAAVLDQIIDYIRSQGYEFATLEDREEYMFPANWR